MKVVTWNVNSIRTRLDRVRAWIEARAPDVLCLQEIKVPDEAFPRAAFEDLGYHVATHGQKTYNGVAILSREPLTDVVRGLPDEGPTPQARCIAATARGVRVYCVYVPNGKHVTSSHFAYKLDWLARLGERISDAHDPGDPLLVLGDFNIAPDERDVHDPDAWRGRVHFHPVEHAALARLAAFGLADVFRHLHAEGGQYSWWDYRGGAFPRDRGLRIDLVLATRPMLERAVACEIDRDERRERPGAAKPSDHAPVLATFSDV